MVSLSKELPGETLYFNFQARKPETQSPEAACPLRYDKFSLASRYVVEMDGQVNTYMLTYLADSFDVDIDIRLKKARSANVAESASPEDNKGHTVEIVALGSRGNPLPGKFFLRKNNEKEEVVDSVFEECLRLGHLTRKMMLQLSTKHAGPHFQKMLQLHQQIAIDGQQAISGLTESAKRLTNLKQGMQLNLSQALFYFYLPGNGVLSFEKPRLDEEWNLKFDFAFSE